MSERGQSAPSDQVRQQARLHRLNEHLRVEWIAGAEDAWRPRTGRPATAEELERVLRRYPGDV
jgi:hypothetical protein